MPENGDEIVYRMHREAIERFRNQPLAEVKRPTIHYTELPEARPDNRFAVEWNLYRREVGRLLAEGNEGKWVLLKGETVVGLFDTREAARAEGHKRYVTGPFLIQQVRVEEPIYRIRGYS